MSRPIRVRYDGGGKAHTLNGVLARLKLHTSPGRFGAKNIHDTTGETLFVGTASEVWYWLRETGRIVTVGIDAAGVAP